MQPTPGMLAVGPDDPTELPRDKLPIERAALIPRAIPMYFFLMLVALPSKRLAYSSSNMIEVPRTQALRRSSVVSSPLVTVLPVSLLVRNCRNRWLKGLRSMRSLRFLLSSSKSSRRVSSPQNNHSRHKYGNAGAQSRPCSRYTEEHQYHSLGISAVAS